MERIRPTLVWFQLCYSVGVTVGISKEVPMDQKSEHLRKLSTARERVVAECHKLAALGRPHERRRPEEMDEGLIAIQNTIDAIDRVLGGKTPITSGKLLSFPTRTLHRPPAMNINDSSMAAPSALGGIPVQLRARKVSRF